jgi:hypothetical protein
LVFDNSYFINLLDDNADEDLLKLGEDTVV